MSQRPDLLKALGKKERQALEAAADHVELTAGETLFEENDVSDALYLLLSGSLGVYGGSVSGNPQLRALIRPGESVGEMGVIAGQPRTATIIAIRDSKLLRLTRKKFDLLLKQQPELMTGINRILVYRLRRATRGGAYNLEPKAIALLPAHAGINVRGLADEFARRLKQAGKRATVIDTTHAHKNSEWFSRQEQLADFVLLSADLADTQWLQVCARQADRIMVVGDGSEKPCCDIASELLEQRAAHQLADLILLQPDNARKPRGTEAWLELLSVNRHFHLRQSHDDDWSRLVRIISGRGVGLVLSGGGARAYAHIGVLKAFEEAGIPVDFVGGASMGAIIAAAVAAGAGIDQVHDQVRASFVESNPLSDYTLPIVSLVRGNKVTRLLRQHFGNWAIADLWLPFYCVSSNLTTGQGHVHHHGQVVEALRASIALPGILPPIITGDGVLADGAIIDNMPVGVMREMHRGAVVAVDVARDLALDPKWLAHEIKMSPFWRLFRPPIIPILMRAGTISGDEQNRRQVGLANLVIQPPLGAIDIRDWEAFDEAVETGYQHTRALLAAHPGIVHSRRTLSVT